MPQQSIKKKFKNLLYKEVSLVGLEPTISVQAIAEYTFSV